MYTLGDSIADFIRDPLGMTLLMACVFGFFLGVNVLFEKSWNCSSTTKTLYVIGLILLILFTKSYFDKQNAMRPDTRPCEYLKSDPNAYDDCIDPGW